MPSGLRSHLLERRSIHGVIHPWNELELIVEFDRGRHLEFQIVQDAEPSFRPAILIDERWRAHRVFLFAPGGMSRADYFSLHRKQLIEVSQLLSLVRFIFARLTFVYGSRILPRFSMRRDAARGLLQASDPIP
jgi:hypothetical protein